MRPTVSICIPLYNSERHLAATIRSVLAQTLEDFELIIVDDGSTDGSVSVARQFDDGRIRVLVNERNLGAADNWDKVCALASGQYIKLLCGDDLLYPTCLERQVEAFVNGGSTTALVASRRDLVDTNGRVVLARRGLSGMAGVVAGDEAIRRAVRSGTNPFGEPCCVLMRKDLLGQAGSFRRVTQYMMDLDMWCRMLAFGYLYAIREPLAAFRLQEQSWSHALAGYQSMQAHAYFFGLRRDSPETVSGWDVVQGTIRASALGLARRTSYALLSVPARLDRNGSPPAADRWVDLEQSVV